MCSSYRQMVHAYLQMVHEVLRFAHLSAQLVFHFHFYRLANYAMVVAAGFEVVDVLVPSGFKLHLVR